MENFLYPMGLPEFKLFRTLVHEHTGIWLRDGKQVMLASRLSRRLRNHGMSGFRDYYNFVRTLPADNEEIRELINCVTTNKTSFFRERHHFNYLASTVVPQIQSAVRYGAARSIRVWSAACSTGEEPYSIAITLLEALKASQRPATSSTSRNLQTSGRPSEGTLLPPGWKVEVFASDIDTKVLDTAGRGIYGEDSMSTIALPLQKRYFLRGKEEMQGFVKVKPAVARLVHFHRINLKDAHWPLEDRFDVIFFRNALIYFNQETQDNFLRKMARHLNPQGHLFLGNAEHIPWLHDVFVPLNQTMYRLADGKP